MNAFLLRYVEAEGAEIILAANGHANAYELTLEQLRALATQAADAAAKWVRDEAEAA